VVYQLAGYCNQTQFDPNPGSPCVGGDAFVTLSNGSGGVQQMTVSLPFSLTIPRPPDGFVYISGQLQGTGGIACAITQGGTLIQQAVSTGQFVIATCSGSV
jgi:hypothetical protein